MSSSFANDKIENSINNNKATEGVGCSPQADSEILRSYQFSTQLIQKKLCHNQFGSFLFEFLSDSIKNKPLPGFIYVGTFSSVVYAVCIYIGCLSIAYLGSSFDSRMNKFLDDVGFFFMYTSPDPNDHYILTFPPFYLQIVIFIICTISYISFFVYKMKRFYGKFLHIFFHYVCLTVSTPMITYEMVSITSSLTMLCLSKKAIYLVIPIIGIYCMPCLIISVLRAMISIAIEENPTTNNSSIITIMWYVSLLFTCGLNAVGQLVKESYIFLIFIFTVIAIPQIIMLHICFTRMFFIDNFTKVLSIFFPALFLFCSILGIFQNICRATTSPETMFLNRTNYAIIIGIGHFLILIFSFFFVKFKLKKYTKIAENLDFNELQKMSNNQLLEMLLYINSISTNENESNRKVIQQIIEMNESIEVKLFALRFLLNSKKECFFIYEKAVNILMRRSSSFIIGIQTTSIIELSINFIDDNIATITSKQELLNHVLSTCYAAQAFFWQAVLHSLPSQILKYADVLRDEIENAQNFFNQFGINEGEYDQYGAQYFDFVINIVGDLEKAAKMIKANKRFNVIDKFEQKRNTENNNIGNCITSQERNIPDVVYMDDLCNNERSNLNSDDNLYSPGPLNFNTNIPELYNNGSRTSNDNYKYNFKLGSKSNDNIIFGSKENTNHIIDSTNNKNNSKQCLFSDLENNIDHKDSMDENMSKNEKVNSGIEVGEKSEKENKNDNTEGNKSKEQNEKSTPKNNFQNNNNITPTVSSNTLGTISQSVSVSSYGMSVINDQCSLLLYKRSLLTINPINRKRVKLCKEINHYFLPRENIHEKSVFYHYLSEIFIAIIIFILSVYLIWSSWVFIDRTNHYIDVLSKVYMIAFNTLRYAVGTFSNRDETNYKELKQLINEIPLVIKSIEESTPKNEIYESNIATSTLLALHYFLNQYFGNCLNTPIANNSNCQNNKGNANNDKKEVVSSSLLPILMNSSSPLSPLFYSSFNTFANPSNSNLSYYNYLKNQENENDQNFDKIQNTINATFYSLINNVIILNDNKSSDCSFFKVSLMNVTISMVNFCNKMLEIQSIFKDKSNNKCKYFQKVSFICNILIVSFFVASLILLIYLLYNLTHDFNSISRQPLLLKKNDVAELFHTFKNTIDEESMREFKDLIKYQTKYTYQIRFVILLIIIFTFHFLYINLTELIFLNHELNLRSTYNLISTLPVLQTSYYVMACIISDSPSYEEIFPLLETTTEVIFEFDNENHYHFQSDMPKNGSALRLIPKNINPIQSMSMFPLRNKTSSANLMSKLKISSRTLYEFLIMMKNENKMLAQFSHFLRSTFNNQSEQTILVESLKELYRDKYSISILFFFGLSFIYIFAECILFYISYRAIKGVRSIISLIVRICTLFPKHSCFASSIYDNTIDKDTDSSDVEEYESDYINDNEEKYANKYDSDNDFPLNDINHSISNKENNERFENFHIKKNSVIKKDESMEPKEPFSFFRPLPDCILENIVNSFPVSVVCTNRKGYIENSNIEFDNLYSQNFHIILPNANHHCNNNNTSESYEEVTLARMHTSNRKVLQIKDFKEVVVDPETKIHRYFLITEFGGKSLPCDEFGRKLNWSGSKCYIINDNTRLQNKKERVRLMSKNVETLRNYILPPAALEMKKERLVMINQLAIIEIVIRNNSTSVNIQTEQKGRNNFSRQQFKSPTSSPKASACSSCLSTLLNPNSLSVGTDGLKIDHQTIKNSSSNEIDIISAGFVRRKSQIRQSIPNSFEDIEFLEFKRELSKISERFSTILTLNITRSQVSVVFRGCSTNRNRQYVREGFSFIQKVIELLHGRQSKIAFMTGSCCICNVDAFANENFSLFSRSFVKAMGMLRCCEWGEVVTEWGVMKTLVNMCKNVSRQGSIYIAGFDYCDYSIIQQANIFV